MCRVAFAIGLAVATVAAQAGRAQTPGAATPSMRLDPPRFADANRRQALAAAFPEIDTLMQGFATSAHVPGIAYGVIVDGELIHTGTFGYRDLDAKAPVDADTVFRIASMTKSFTALSVLKLRDEGKLSLDDLAERYVPELKTLVYPTTDSPRLTIRHLLSHSAGFPEDNPWGDRQLADSDAQLSAMLRQGIPFSHAPGTAYEYSNYGFAILGRIVTRVSGMPYRDYVTANLLKPLGMTSSTLDATSVPPARLAHGYRWEDERWKDEPLLHDGAFGSMGGMMTSIKDLGRYVAFMMSAWPPRNDDDRGPVRRASVREMQQVWRWSPGAVRRDADGALQLTAGGYAFGLRVSQSCAFPFIVSHSGGLPGFGSQMRWLPGYGVGVIALGNLTYTGWGQTIDRAFDALRRTGALQPREPQPSPALTEMKDAVSRLVTSWDDGLADRIAAENLYLDHSKERRRQELEAIHAQLGTCRPGGRFDVENPMRGRWVMSCERGTLEVAITLAPTMPPRVQYLAVRANPPAAAPKTDGCGQ